MKTGEAVIGRGSEPSAVTLVRGTRREVGEEAGIDLGRRPLRRVEGSSYTFKYKGESRLTMLIRLLAPITDKETASIQVNQTKTARGQLEDKHANGAIYSLKEVEESWKAASQTRVSPQLG